MGGGEWKVRTVQKFCRKNHQPNESAIANCRSRMTHAEIMGAAGRDFHNFYVVFRNDPQYRVVAFTAAQIPNIAGRRYLPELAGTLYPTGIPIEPEEELESVIVSHSVGQVIFAYSDVSHEQVMHQASRALAAGADFRLLGPRTTTLPSSKPVISVCAVQFEDSSGRLCLLLTRLLAERGLKKA
jgi:predicted GTPase